ncbi:MAG: type II toxin-antitoxin system CcdA family antitoxin [Magnetospirillum sp.]|nr:type II toxin-antitoxin system CcdA family antitoxin [Magnetospirillum sp.]
MDECKKDKTPLKAKVWLRENLDALLSSNEFVERHGLPLKVHGKLLTAHLTETK